MISKEEKYLSSIYYNPKHPGSFSGPTKILQVVRKEGKFSIGLSQIKKWLAGQETYTFYRGMRTKFKRNKVIVRGIDDQWDIDLMDMVSLAEANDGVKYVLLCIDILSRHITLQPLKTKQGNVVVTALKKIFSQGRKPMSIRSDKGGEFANKWVKDFLKKEQVAYYITHNETKANYAERGIKTIKGKIFKSFLEQMNHRYVDKLQDFAYGYNHTIHGGLYGMSPSEINTPLIVAELLAKQREPKVKKFKVKVKMESKKKKRKRKRGFKYKVNDTVSVSYLRETFAREYSMKWSGEVFTITHRSMRQGIPVYKIKDFEGEKVEGIFYENELQKVIHDPDKAYKIAKVHDKKDKKGRHLVSFLGWPKKYDDYVDKFE